MALKIEQTKIDAVKGESNVWDLDASIPIDAAQDKIWFTAKNKKSDLDADAVLKYGLNVPGLAGVTVLNASAGQFRVTSPQADTGTLTVRALVYDVKVKVASSNTLQTVASGSVYLAEATNKDAT